MAGNKNVQKQEKKLQFAFFVAEKKDVLFGKFSNTVTHKDKIKAWTDAVEFCSELGLIKGEHQKNIEYVKNLWGNMKQRAIANKNYRDKTGAARNKGREMNDTDHKVIEIIGEKSPVVIGLGLPESSGRNRAVSATATQPTDVAGNAQSNSECSSQIPTVSPQTPRSSRSIEKPSDLESPITPQQFRRINLLKRKNSLDEITALKKKKYEVQNDVLLLQKKNLEMQQKILQIKLRKQEKCIEVYNALISFKMPN